MWRVQSKIHSYFLSQIVNAQQFQKDNFDAILGLFLSAQQGLILKFINIRRKGYLAIAWILKYSAMTDAMSNTHKTRINQEN
ncbi:hypothetical protein [Nostoc sp.]|uniref:hypothetical protein n=1 Tax=Nostoc sp. TaxID=1180 RepID=UPI001DE6CA68|nr:hypothetical protein [Nostoc sp. JL23]